MDGVRSGCWTRWGLALASGLLALAPALATDPPPAKSFTVTFGEGRVAVRAESSSLREVLAELGRQVGFEVEADIPDDVRVVTAFEGQPIEDAIRRLCKAVGYVQVADPKTGRIAKVILTPQTASVARAASRLDAPAARATAFSPEVLAEAFGPSEPTPPPGQPAQEPPPPEAAADEADPFRFQVDPGELEEQEPAEEEPEEDPPGRDD